MDDSREHSLLVPVPGNSVFLQGGRLAFIVSSTCLSADHVSLLAPTVGKLQIKFMTHRSQVCDRGLEINIVPGFFFPFSQTLVFTNNLVVFYAVFSQRWKKNVFGMEWSREEKEEERES